MDKGVKLYVCMSCDLPGAPISLTPSLLIYMICSELNTSGGNKYSNPVSHYKFVIN